VDLDLIADQELLRDTARRFVEDACPLPVVRTLLDDERGYPADYLRRSAELGWFALLVAEEHGGGSVSGDGLRDAALVAEVRGAELQPGPFVGMNVVAYALSRHGSPRQVDDVLPGVVAGETVATWALADPRAGLSGPATVTAEPGGDGFRLSGTCAVVPDAPIADHVLVPAVLGDGVVQFLIATDAPGVRVERLDVFDLTRRAGRVDLEGVTVGNDDAVGASADGSALLSELLDVASVLTVAETVGAMAQLFETTVQYAKDRVAFGRPIGSFQALKHQLADLSLALEMSVASVEAAAHAVAGGDPLGPQLASVAKAFVGEAAIDIAQGCLQVHGGIGYTWEHDLHLYLRRASADQAFFGSPAWHRERMLRLAGV
jgi:alkylation response protein AidB-like acyl-CoA dehydrogenase